MAKKFVIAVAPTFKSKVSVPRVGADPLEVEFVFKAKSRKELATLFSKWGKEFEELRETGSDFTLEDWAEAEITLQVGQVKDIVVGWNFDDEFNDENIEALVNSSISVTEAITNAYNTAYVSAKQGN